MKKETDPAAVSENSAAGNQPERLRRLPGQNLLIAVDLFIISLLTFALFQRNVNAVGAFCTAVLLIGVRAFHSLNTSSAKRCARSSSFRFRTLVLKGALLGTLCVLNLANILALLSGHDLPWAAMLGWSFFGLSLAAILGLLVLPEKNPKITNRGDWRTYA